MASKKHSQGDLFDFAGTLNEYAFVPSEKSLYDIDGWCDTGIKILNAALSDSDIDKGLVAGKRYVIAGENSTAKTLISLQIASKFLNAGKHNRIIYFESEGAVLKQHLEEVGIDMSRIKFMPVAFIEDFRSQSIKLLDKYLLMKKAHKAKPAENEDPGELTIILDSLGMLNTYDESEKIIAESETKSMTKSQLIASTYRQLAMRLAISKATLITIQHVHNEQGKKSGGFASFGAQKKVIAGGETLKFCGDVIIYLSKTNEYENSKGEGSTKEDNAVKFTSSAKVGIKTTMEIIKSRLMRDNVKFPLTILYGVGILPYSGLFQYGIDAGVFQLRSNMYENTMTGKKFYKKDIVERPEEIYDAETLAVIRNHIYQAYSLFGKPSLDQEDVKNFIESENA